MRMTRSTLRCLVAIISTVGAVLALWLVTQAPAAAVTFQARTGQEVFAATCAQCHQDFGQGIPGTFPPLAANPAAADPDYVAATISDGLTEDLEIDGIVYTTDMPPVVGTVGR